MAEILAAYAENTKTNVSYICASTELAGILVCLANNDSVCDRRRKMLGSLNNPKDRSDSAVILRT